MAPRILAIIPCYNESGSIGKLLEEFKGLDFAVDTLVIDDGSTDDTYDIACRYSHVTRHDNNGGVVSAIRTGISYALENNYDYCIQLDGDGQHIPSEIAYFIKNFKNSPVDIYIGSRYSGYSWQPGVTIPRRLACLSFSLFLLLLFGRWISDPLSGMRLMNKKTMMFFLSSVNDHTLDAEIVPLFLKQNLTMREIPIKTRKRISGVSHVEGMKGVTFLLRLFYRTLVIWIGHFKKKERQLVNPL